MIHELDKMPRQLKKRKDDKIAVMNNNVTMSQPAFSAGDLKFYLRNLQAELRLLGTTLGLQVPAKDD